MFNRTLTPADLARLKQDREDADRAYNDALTALGGAAQRLREMPHPPPPYDEHQITPLNERWNLLQVRPADEHGWRGRLRSFIWQAVAPLFERQQEFNASMVDHINRNVAMHREFAQALASSIDLMREELEQLVHFQHRLIQYAQQITPFVDTKDRDVTRLIIEVAGGLNAVSDELSKRWESMVARERRFEQRATERERALEDLRSSFGVVHHVTQTLKRELGRLPQTSPVGSGDGDVDVETPHPGRALVPDATLNSYKYVGFEDQYRGSTEEIQERLASYLPYFDGASDVLDTGCGRGEFLALLQAHGVSARGVDSNHEMVESCRKRGLAADEADALTFVQGLPDASLGGLFAAQVVEHLEPAYLLQLLDAAFLKLRPGATLILETINAASWSAFFHSYIRDLTHVRPLHPDTLTYFVTASGFQDVRVEYKSPWPPSTKLEPLPMPPSGDAAATPEPMTNLLIAFNHNVEKLNTLLFADQDYAVIGERR